MFRKWLYLVPLLVGVGTTMLACGSDDKTPPPSADGGSGGSGGDDGEGGTGGTGAGGTGGEGGDENQARSCEDICDLARDSCNWLDGESEAYTEERSLCLELCSQQPECVGAAIDSCDAREMDACFLSPDESEACTEMCDHVYYDCGMNLNVSRAQCGVGCSKGDFDAAQIECFTNAACELDEMSTCFDPGGEDEPADEGACEAACTHLIDECGSEAWGATSCVRACNAAYTPAEKECLATIACDEDPVTTCFAEFSCVGMCNHVYNECGATIGDGAQEDCEVLCRWGLFSDSEITCFSSAQCADLDACSELEPEE